MTGWHWLVVADSILAGLCGLMLTAFVVAAVQFRRKMMGRKK